MPPDLRVASSSGRAIPTAAVVVAFFAVVFFHFAHPLADGDLWWHLNTGRWIVEHRALPDSDPFTSTVSAGFADRARMFVRSNWLAQIAYYALYRFTGFNGLRVFNAALFTAIAVVIYRTLRLHGLGAWWALLLTSPCAALAWHYDELRPLGFSILFTAVFAHLLERAGRGSKPQQCSLALMALVPLSVMWANMHRGFPLMFLLLVPYLAAWLWSARYTEALWVTLAGAASLANPSGPAPVVSALAESFQGTGSFYIMELAAPWEFARITGPGSSYLPLLLVTLLISLLFMVLEWRTVRLEHVLLYAFYAVAGLTAFRYSIYLAVIAVSTCAPYAARVLESSRIARLRRLAPFGVLGAMGAMVWTSARPTAQGVYMQALPVGAVSAMREQGLPGPLLNPFDWGGYIAWAAWPQYQVFTDSRLLDYSVLRKLEQAVHRHAAPLLREYGINTVIFPPADLVELRSVRIVRELMTDADWKLVFFDQTATVFVRRQASPCVPEVGKDRLGAYLLSVVSQRVRKKPLIADDFFELAAILAAMGREQEASRAHAQGLAMLKNAGPTT